MPVRLTKNAAWWSKPAVQRVGRGHEDRACNTNDLQTFAYFTGSCAQLPSKSPVLPLEVIVPGWLGDRCQVAPPQLIHHAKQRRKADLRLSLSLFLSLSAFLCSFLLVCLFLVTLNNYIVITSVCPELMFPLICDKVCGTVHHQSSCNSLTHAVKARQAASRDSFCIAT